MLKEADDRALWTGRTGFAWTKNPWRPASWGALTAPDGLSLARAHAQTGDEKYLRALVLATQTGTGANPLNLCYTTGVGHDWPQHPLHIDSRITNQSPPPGLTVFGPMSVAKQKDYWGQKIAARFCHPAVLEWPTAGSLLGRVLVPAHVRIHRAEPDGAERVYMGLSGGPLAGTAYPDRSEQWCRWLSQHGCEGGDHSSRANHPPKGYHSHGRQNDTSGSGHQRSGSGT